MNKEFKLNGETLTAHIDSGKEIPQNGRPYLIEYTIVIYSDENMKVNYSKVRASHEMLALDIAIGRFSNKNSRRFDDEGHIIFPKYEQVEFIKFWGKLEADEYGEHEFTSARIEFEIATGIKPCPIPRKMSGWSLAQYEKFAEGVA